MLKTFRIRWKTVSFFIFSSLFLVASVFQTIDRYTVKQRSSLSTKLWTTKLRECTVDESEREAAKLKCPQKNIEGITQYYNPDIPVTWSDESPELKPETYAWWRSLQGFIGLSFGSPNTILKQMFHSGFSARNNFNTKPPGCLSCAIVGNSHILRDSCYGKLIDAHSFVFRFNGAVIKGYETQVGARTTHLFAFPESCPEKISKNASLVLLTYKKSDLKWLNSATSDGSYRLWSYRPAFDKISVDKNKIIIINPEFMKYVHDTWTAGAGNFASTGIIATVAGLHICDTVTLFGFGADKNGLWQHYFEVLNVGHFAHISHGQQVEAKLLQDLENYSSIMRYY